MFFLYIQKKKLKEMILRFDNFMNESNTYDNISECLQYL
jgi:hypothetical protein